MNSKLTQRQRIRFFVMNIGAFALIFSLLGVIILHFLDRSAYQETDQSLVQMSQNQAAIQQEITRYRSEDKNTSNPSSSFSSVMKRSLPNNAFNTQIILWSKDGEILNNNALGDRLNQLQTLRLNSKSLGSVTAVNVDGQNDEKLNFRSITIANEDGDIAYIQFLSNTDQIQYSLRTFKLIISAGLIIFWLISIGVSYILSALFMKPVLSAWQKQQEFVEHASHELRTPLTIIQSGLERLLTKPNQTVIDVSEIIASALKETRRLSHLTTDLLTIARGDSNQLILNKESVNLATFISKSVQPFKEIATLEHKRFVFENDTDNEQTIQCDREKIKQVLIILLDNALKYTQNGDTITVIAQIKKNHWTLECRNTGAIIPEEDQKKIFDRFYRIEKTRSKNQEGYGLGLVIAKQIIEEHRGQITVDNLGTNEVRFLMTLPLK